MKIPRIFKERDPTKGSIIKNALAMTTPMWLNSAYLMVFMLVEMYWVSRLGMQTLAALAIGGTAFMLLMAPIRGMVTASYGMIGNLVGQKNEIQLQKTVKEILGVGFLLSLALAFLGYFLGPILLKLLGAETEVFSQAAVYLRISAMGGVITFLFWIIDGMLRSARGITPAAIATWMVITLNIIFDYLLIFGNFGFPRMEVAGVALARVISAGAGTLIGFWMLTKGESFIKINLKNWQDFKVKIQTLKEIIRIAVPNGLEEISRTAVVMIILVIVAPFGTSALAVYGIGQRILRVCSIFSFALGKTTTITVSQNLGASKIKRAEKAGWIHGGLNMLLIGGAGFILFIFASQVISIFSRVPEVLEIGVNYLRITTFAGIGYALLALGVILERVFFGVKDTRTPLLVFWVMAVVQIGLAILLPKFFGLGINGVWIALLAGMIFYGLALATLFKTGYWKPKKPYNRKYKGPRSSHGFFF